MEPMDLNSSTKIFVALIVGFITGFALLKSDMLWRKSVMDILTLKNGRMIKSLLFFIGCGAIGFYFLERNGIVNIHVGKSYLWASIAGGAITGIGLVLCGFTPLSAAANISTGRVYLIWTILGMLFALPIAKIVDEKLSHHLYSWGDKISSPSTNSGEVLGLQIMKAERFISLDNGAFITAVICFVLIIIVQFTLGDSSESD